jgi:hypothetical protein
MLFSVAVVAVVFGPREWRRWKSRRRLMESLRARESGAEEWRRRFPKVPDDEVHEYLGLFTQAFGLPDNLRRHLRPDDCVGDI